MSLWTMQRDLHCPPQFLHFFVMTRRAAGSLYFALTLLTVSVLSVLVAFACGGAAGLNSPLDIVY